MKMYFHAMNVKPYYISPMNHESKRAERYIRTLNNIICRNLTGLNYKPRQTGINVSTKQYLEKMFKRKAMMDQFIIYRKTYEKNTQWIREMRKYPNHETFAVGDLVLVYHPIGSVLQSASRKLNRNWIGPLKIQVFLDNTHYLCSDWSGMLIPKRFHINRVKQYYMNPGEVGKNGQLKIVENVNELCDLWNELKGDELLTDSSQGNLNREEINSKQ